MQQDDGAAETMGGAAPAALSLAYLTTEYPKVSHTFIRREILALEAQGFKIRRFALRGWDTPIADDQDRVERERTRYVLGDGVLPLMSAVARMMVRRPGAFLSALGLAFRLGRRALRPMPYHFVYLAHACRLYEWLEKDPVDHLHVHFGTNAAETALLLRQLGGPSYSFTVHGADEADHAPYLKLDLKTKAAKFVVAISSYLRSQMLRQLPPEQWDKVKVVHCGIDRTFFSEVPAPFPSRPRLVCVGRFSTEKGHLVLLEAFAKTAGDAELVLVGDGPLRGEIEARIKALGIEDRVRITGWVSSADVRAEIMSGTALVQPSFQEGLPVVIMEAMAVGRPVISTYVAGIPELVRPDETGWLVPASDVPALTEAMDATIAATPEELGAMGEASIARVRSRHSIDDEAVRLARLFSGTETGGHGR